MIEHAEVFFTGDDGIVEMIGKLNEVIEEREKNGLVCVSLEALPATYSNGRQVFRRTIILGFQKKKSDPRIELEALISEREAMIALNTFRSARGETIAYDDVHFFENARSIRALAGEDKA